MSIWIYSSPDDLFLVIDGKPAEVGFMYKTIFGWKIEGGAGIYREGYYPLSELETKEIPGEFIR